MVASNKISTDKKSKSDLWKEERQRTETSLKMKERKTAAILIPAREDEKIGIKERRKER